MKRTNDIIVLTFIVATVSLGSYFITRLIFGGANNLTTNVEVVDPITSDFVYENKPYFSKGAINPTRDISVQENNNAQPLGTE